MRRDYPAHKSQARNLIVKYYLQHERPCCIGYTIYIIIKLAFNIAFNMLIVCVAIMKISSKSERARHRVDSIHE